MEPAVRPDLPRKAPAPSGRVRWFPVFPAVPRPIWHASGTGEAMWSAPMHLRTASCRRSQAPALDPDPLCRSVPWRPAWASRTRGRRIAEGS
jgi:hypothetical protein